MPITGSTVVITVGGTDVTRYVLFASARFESQLGAMPGTADIVLKDVDQALDFTTGDELTLDIDGLRLWGGYVLSATRQFAFPAADTTVPANVKVRQWRLSGVDYNILFDKRVIHNPADPYHHLPFFSLDLTMGELLRDQLFADYLDIGGDGLDTTTFVDDLYVPRFDASGNPDPDASKQGSWPQQGLYWRKAMEDFAQFGAIYYIDGSKNVHFTDLESIVPEWGFSDVPNKNAIPSVGATYGMREFEEIEDASAMANDALVWGGSEWAGTTGGTVFARAQNSGSIALHNRWQYAETKFGELKDQGMVTARANVIVSGNTTGAVGGDTARGLAVDQKQIRATWFAHDVPLLSGTPAHLKPSDVVTFTMYVLSEDGINPLVTTLPLRTISVTFPTLESATGDAFVRFDGFFGVQLSDPYWLWKFLRDFSPGAVQPPPTIATADGSTTSAIYGTFASLPFNESPDGSRTVFSIDFAYINGTTAVYRNGLRETPGIAYTESDPNNGQITFIAPPAAPDELWLSCRIAGGLP
jgi:hypothetical protein